MNKQIKITLRKFKYEGLSLKKVLRIILTELDCDYVLTKSQQQDMCEIILRYSRSLSSQDECIQQLENYVRSESPYSSR